MQHQTNIKAIQIIQEILALGEKQYSDSWSVLQSAAKNLINEIALSKTTQVRINIDKLAGFLYTLNEVAGQINICLRVWQPTAATMAAKPLGSGGNAWASQCGKKIEHTIGSHDGLLWHTVFFSSMSISAVSDPDGVPGDVERAYVRK